MSNIQTIDTVRAEVAFDDAQKVDFLKAEYQEAAKAYALGVQAGQDFMRQYMFGNGILAALFGAAISLLKEHHAAARAALVVIPLVGILGAGIVVLAVPLYRKHLNNCRERCSEIEKKFDGQLFSRIRDISASTRLGAIFSLCMICATFALFWIVMLVVEI